MRLNKIWPGITCGLLAISAAIITKATHKGGAVPSYYRGNFNLCTWGPFTHCDFDPNFHQRCYYMGYPLYTDPFCVVPAYYDPL